MKRSNTADRPGGPYGTRTQPEAGAEPTRTQPRGRSRCRALAAAARAPKAACHLSAAFSLTLLLPPPRAFPPSFPFLAHPHRTLFAYSFHDAAALSRAPHARGALSYTER